MSTTTNEPTKQREGDQVLPTGNEALPPIQDRIIAEMEESKRVGMERYGQHLRPFNGRRSIQDIREEVRDLLVYMTQVEVETEASRDQLVDVVAGELDKHLAAINTPLAETIVDRILGHVAGSIMNMPDIDMGEERSNPNPALDALAIEGIEITDDPRPDYRSTLPIELLRYVTEALSSLNALQELRDEESRGVELDNIPVHFHEGIVGYLVISEIDGRYEFAPVKNGASA